MLGRVSPGSLMPTTSIIILSWNGKKMLEASLPSVLRFAPVDTEVLVVDNGSEDETLAWLSQHYPAVKQVALNRNVGYCAGNNYGARFANGRYLVFLNNDVLVKHDWLSPLIALFDNPEIGAAQPKVCCWNDPRRFEYAGAAGGFLDRHGIPFCRGRLFDSLEVDDGQYDDPCDLDWASGAAFAVRADLFRRAGGFDERFFCHMEEIDLCWRFRAAGYRIRFAPDSCVYHQGGATLSRGSPQKVYYNYRNNLLMLAKHLSPVRLGRTLFARIGLDAMAAVRWLLFGQAKHAVAVARAYFAAMQVYPAIFRSRREADSNSSGIAEGSAHQACGGFSGSVTWAYFVRGISTHRRLAAVQSSITSRRSSAIPSKAAS